MKRSRLAAAVAAVVVPLLLTACGTATAGAAAVVGDRRISEGDLQRATADITAYINAGQQTPQQVPQAQVLFFLAAGPDLVDAANRAGVGVSMDDARRDLGAKLVAPSEPGLLVWQASQAIGNINGLAPEKAAAIKTRLGEVLRNRSIQVNPRYGVFDAANVTIATVKQNWIVPSPSTTPVAQGASPAPS